MLWEFEDAIGVRRIGMYMGTTEFSGTDVGYHFHCPNTGVHIVRGAALKSARPLIGKRS